MSSRVIPFLWNEERNLSLLRSDWDMAIYIEHLNDLKVSTYPGGHELTPCKINNYQKENFTWNCRCLKCLPVGSTSHTKDNFKNVKVSKLLDSFYDDRMEDILMNNTANTFNAFQPKLKTGKKNTLISHILPPPL